MLNSEGNSKHSSKEEESQGRASLVLTFTGSLPAIHSHSVLLFSCACILQLHFKCCFFFRYFQNKIWFMIFFLLQNIGNFKFYLLVHFLLYSLGLSLLQYHLEGAGFICGTDLVNKYCSKKLNTLHITPGFLLLSSQQRITQAVGTIRPPKEFIKSRIH